jgi:predicted metal-dependent enzyme (double-stranded beta helix superfamily)
MFSLATFIAQCQEALRESSPATVVEVLVKEAIADPAGIRAAFAPTANAKSVGDAAVFRSDTLTILDVTNSPGLKTPAHNHRMWAVIGVYDGEEQNVFYQEGANGLEPVGGRLLRAGDVAVLNEDTIHAISNPLDRKSYAIHVYGGDIVTREGRSMWNPYTQVCEPYDINRLSAYVREMTKG